jgi:hypothetical protein
MTNKNPVIYYLKEFFFVEIDNFLLKEQLAYKLN